MTFGHRDPVALIAIEGFRHDDDGLLGLPIVKGVGAIVHRIAESVEILAIGEGGGKAQTISGAADRLRFTAALANGQDLYAFRYAVNDRANTLYYRESDDAIVIVSEPLDRNHRNWIAVPESHVLIAKAGEKARVVPFLCERREAAE